MLRIIQNSGSAGAKSYYSTADYYTEGQELQGEWHGAGAARLGLSGPIAQPQWDALCDNRHPSTDLPLTVRNYRDRRVGYDFNFHVPKSVSLLYGLTQDAALLEAFRSSVRETMAEMEQEMQTRVRKEGRNEDRVTGNMVWGEFTHFTSRPVGGVPCPHLHSHCFVFNSTWDLVEHRWKAGQFGAMKQSASYFESVFQSKLASRMNDLGLGVDRTQAGWEIAGFSKATLKKFSRRTTQIEETARTKGITSEAQKAELGALTREHKAKKLSMEQLRDEWWLRLSDAEQDDVRSALARIGGEPVPEHERAAREAAEHALEHSFERESVVVERALLRQALRHSFGQARRETVEREVANQNLIRDERAGRTLVTHRSVLAEEAAMLDFARRGKGTEPPLGMKGRPLQREWLNEGQKRAVHHVLDSPDRVIAIRGAAGTGKTTLMREAVEGIEAGGRRVFTFAPSAGASRGVLRSEGFSDADTVARLLADPQLQEKLGGEVVWIDEAGLIGVRTMKQIFDLAERQDFRLILSGDIHQHAAVERGAALRLLETDAGLVPAEVTAIQRQEGRYMRAVAALSEGKVEAGFRQLDAMGWIKEVPDDERYKALANEFVSSALEGKTALVVSPTHAEGDRTTAEIRCCLREAGLLGTEQRTFTVLRNTNLTTAERGDAVNFEPDDVLLFHQNAKGGHRKGEQVHVGSGPIPLQHARHFTAFRPGRLSLSAGDRVRVTHNGKTKDGAKRLNNGDLFTVKGFNPTGDIELTNGWTIGKEFGHLAQGYVITSHAAQGKSVNKVIMAQSSASFAASSREQFYVSASRGKEALTIYCDDREALLAAVSRGDDRLTATEFIAGREPRRGIMIAQAAQKSPEREPQPREMREEVCYER